MNLRQAAQQALEALNRLYNDSEIMVTHDQHRDIKAAITALRAALAEPEQEPLPNKALRGLFILANTAEPREKAWPDLERFARAIERAHGIGEQHE